MPERPDTSVATQQQYAELEPHFVEEDELNGYHLLLFMDALCSVLLEDVRSWVADRDNMPGWAILLDVDEAPENVLGWQSQFIGAILTQGASADVHREEIKRPANLVRGRLKTILEEVQATLDGTKIVTIKERFGFGEDHAYRLFVRTYDAQTKDEAYTRSVLESAVPGGIRVDYESVPGITYDQSAEKYTDYDDLAEGYATYNEMATDLP